MKKYLIIIALSFLIILSGCKSNQPTTKGSFLGGTDGVEISFVNLFPPSQFSQNDSNIQVKVLLKNKGETRVATGNAKSRIFGINLDTFGLTQDYRATLGPLEGRSESSPGDEKEIELGTIKYKGSIINSQDSTLRARLCYIYQTKSDLQICLKSILSQEAGNTICDLNGEKVTKTGVSSAPIQITSVKEQTTGSDQVRLDVVIENKGKGEVFPVNSDCKDLDDEIKRVQNKNRVNVRIDEPVGIKCSFRTGEPSNEGIITLDSTGKATLSCWTAVEEPKVDHLKLFLDYVYRDQATKQVTIYETRR